MDRPSMGDDNDKQYWMLENEGDYKYSIHSYYEGCLTHPKEEVKLQFPCNGGVEQIFKVYYPDFL